MNAVVLLLLSILDMSMLMKQTLMLVFQLRIRLRGLAQDLLAIWALPRDVPFSSSRCPDVDGATLMLVSTYRVCLCGGLNFLLSNLLLDGPILMEQRLCLFQLLVFAFVVSQDFSAM